MALGQLLAEVRKNSLEYPDFYIVGAAKSGTTFLQQYLGRHPSIAMLPDEPHYFGSDLWPAELRLNDLNAYSPMVAEARTRRTLVGDKSVWYLYSTEAAREIRCAAPESKIIISIRNPCDMLYSLYHYWRKCGIEDAPSFEKALGLESQRRKGRRIPDVVHPHPNKFYYYSEIARLDEQIGRFLQFFPRPQVHIVNFDDIRSDPRRVLNSLFDFLGIHGLDFDSTKTVNAGRQRVIRLPALRGLVRNRATVRLYRKSLRNFPASPFLSGMSALFNRTFSSYRAVQPMSEETRHRLATNFRECVNRLEDIVSCDLSIWR